MMTNIFIIILGMFWCISVAAYSWFILKFPLLSVGHVLSVFIIIPLTYNIIGFLHDVLKSTLLIKVSKEECGT